MKLIKLKLKEGSYNIVIGNNIVNRLGRYIRKLDLGNTAYIITNNLIKNKHGHTLSEVLRTSGIDIIFKTVPDTEKSKSIEVSMKIVMDISRYDKKRRMFIIAFGGGVIGDLAGFVASIYKRGIPYIQIPTTLLAQVDSSIGGKTAIDLVEGKNLVGAIYQPRLVLSEIGFLKTLNRRQILSGLAEIIKYGIIKDKQLFVYLENKYKRILALKSDCFEYIILRCSLIKTMVVQKDEREEKGIRTILNFGHTIGHAIESAANYKKYNHGEAVALGMLAAADISRQLRLISQNNLWRIEKLIKNVGLPVKVKGISTASIINAHYRDKKFKGGKNRFVLIQDIGKTKILEGVPLEIIRKAIRKIR